MVERRWFAAALVLAAAMAAAACGGGGPGPDGGPAVDAPGAAGDQSAVAADADGGGQGPAASEQPAEPGGDPVDARLPEDAVSDDDVDAARQQIKAAVDAYIAPVPTQQLTNAELGCLASSVVDSLSDERLVGLAPVLTVHELSDGIPSGLLDPAESERILDAASRCVDWAAVMERSYLSDGSDPQAEPPECVAEAVAAPQFAQRAARVSLFEDANRLGDVMGLFGVDCYIETTKEQLVQGLAAEGVSAESAACIGDRVAQGLLAAADDPEGPEASIAVWEILGTTLDCLTEEDGESPVGAEDGAAGTPAAGAGPDPEHAPDAAGDDAVQPDRGLAVGVVEEPGGGQRLEDPVQPDLGFTVEVIDEPAPRVSAGGSRQESPLQPLQPLEPLEPGGPDGSDESGGPGGLPSAQGEAYTWHDGDRTLGARLLLDLVVMGDGAVSSNDDVVADTRNGQIVTRDDGASAAGGASGGHPVFISDSGTLMTLPGGVIVVLDEDWDTDQAAAFFARNGISLDRVSGLDYLANGFFVETEPGFASLDLANALAGQPGVELSSPNWWRDRTTR